MAICEPPAKIDAPVIEAPSETPYTDRLREWWTEDKYYCGDFHDDEGERHCALGALEINFGFAVMGMFCLAAREHVWNGGLTRITSVSDHEGHAAALAYIEDLEKEMRADGRL